MDIIRDALSTEPPVGPGGVNGAGPGGGVGAARGAGGVPGAGAAVVATAAAGLGGPSGIASQRSYRSRRNRPCDRCRSRKQRCVIPPPSQACLNCSLAGAECTFDEPATKRIRHAQGESRPLERSAGEDNAEQAEERAAAPQAPRPRLGPPPPTNEPGYDDRQQRMAPYPTAPFNAGPSPHLAPALPYGSPQHVPQHVPPPHHQSQYGQPYYEADARRNAAAHVSGPPSYASPSPSIDDPRFRALHPHAGPVQGQPSTSSGPPMAHRHALPPRAPSTAPSARSEGSPAPPHGHTSSHLSYSAHSAPVRWKTPTLPASGGTAPSPIDGSRSSSSLGAGSGMGPGPASPAKPPQQQNGGHHHTHQFQHHRSASSTSSATKPGNGWHPAHSNAAARAASLSEIFADIFNSSRTELGSGPDPPTDYRSLDSDAGEDYELHFIGATSERDALVLSAIASISRISGSAGLTSTYRMRQVSEDPAAPVVFLFNPTKTYDEAYIESHLHVRDPLVALEQLLGAGRLPALMQKFLELDGQAIPLWSEDSTTLSLSSSNTTSKSLQACYICTAVIYFPELRHLAPAAWSISVNHIRALPNRARLATIQANLLDLAGRPSVNRRVNLLRLGETVAAARLLALHLDCSQWKIPPWEKRLRTRLWWSLLMHDKWLALCHGHSSSISVHEWNVSLPRASAYDPPSYRSFILLCELTMLLDEALSTLCSVRIYESDRRRPDWKLAAVADLGRKLDASRAQMDQLDGAVRLSLRSGDVMPAGFHSLRLSFHAVAMLLSRTALDSVTGNDSVATSAVVSAQQGVLQVAEDVVEFVCCLTDLDFAGYWSVYCSAHLSKTLILLFRLTIQADRTDPSPSSIWSRTIRALARFLRALSDAQRDHAWDIADLAVARARDIVPLLMQQIPELDEVLQPLKTLQPAQEEEVNENGGLADTFDLSKVFSGFGEAWDGSQPLGNWYPLIATWHAQGVAA